MRASQVLAPCVVVALAACSNSISLKSDGTGSPLVVVYPGSGRPASMGRSAVMVKMRTGSPTVAELVCSVGGGSVMTQTLPGTDSLWYVREGTLTLHVPGRDAVLGPGAVAFIPRNVPHSYENVGASPTQVVLAFSPPGVERFYDALAERTESAPGELVDPELLKALGQAHGIMFGSVPKHATSDGVMIRGGDEAREAQLGPNRLVVKAGAADTGGSMGALELFAPSGRNGMPQHRIRGTDMAWYVLDGEMTVKTPDRTVQLPAGSLMQVPHGVPHAYENSGLTTAHVLLLYSPGGFERFYEELGKASLHSMHWPPPDEVTRPIASRNGVEMASAPRRR